ncbi:hypothetical protein EJ04DRAFT_560972 [Polyplosphaeria fusca]|uniref:Mediator of RNA polymerase II transcription subunit 17 n=1 Tax=Polyplosphaeria fusca TaxID=682080 RepID=A0A9P4R777_9PLEO|nr:hypothetical protein EJ04DRAFT_560972 [Polyplosphaeria fusca]
MSEDAPTTDIALRPWPSASKEALSAADLTFRVSQLAVERGHLRFVTEEILQEEIASGKHSTDDVMEGVEEAEGVRETKDAQKRGPSKQERLEELSAARLSVFGHADWAAHYAHTTLDLVALLLSKDPKKNLDNSFSHMFKGQKIKRGTFSLDTGKTVIRRGDRRDMEEIEAKHQKQQRLVARGSRMNALERLADNVLEAAKQMETDVRRETKYWDEVLSVSQKGWALQRLRKGVRGAPVTVRFGYPEARDQFRARGYAPLRMDKDGSIIMDPALKLKPKTLRVRISDNGKTTGTSTLAAAAASSSLAIERSVQLAKDSIFEEELYHEITQESRQLLSFGVEVRNRVVNVPVPGPDSLSTSRKILIDCVPREENVLGHEDHSQDWLAQNVAEALRLLLGHEHRMRLFRRSQDPPPLTQQKRQIPQAPLLRILLGVFAHIGAINSLQVHLGALVTILRAASLPIHTKIVCESSWVQLMGLVQDSKRKEFSAVDQVLEVFTKPLEGRVTVILPSSNEEKLTTTIRTYFGPPTFGTEYRVALPPSLVQAYGIPPEQKHDFQFWSAEEVQSYVADAIAMDLTHNVLFEEYRDKAGTGPGPRITIASMEGKSLIQRSVSVHLDEDQLRVNVGLKTALGENSSAKEQEYTWDGRAPGSQFKAEVKQMLG